MGLLDGWRLCPRCGHELERARARPPRLPGRAARSTTRTRRRRCRACSSATGACCSRSARSSRGSATGTCPAGSSRRARSRSTACGASSARRPGLEVEPVEWLGAFLDPYNQLLRARPDVDRPRRRRAAAPRTTSPSSRGSRPTSCPAEMAFASQERVLRAWADASRAAEAIRVTRLLRSSRDPSDSEGTSGWTREARST